VSFGDPGVARAVLGSALYLAVAGLLGLALPGTAGLAVTTVHPDPATSLGAWTGFGVFCAYAAVLLGCAAVRMRRGDA
jgi:ABC-2 type transport system permease protein